MRTVSRLAISAAVAGAGLSLAAPASAQELCKYPFDCEAPVGPGEGPVGPGPGEGPVGPGPGEGPVGPGPGEGPVGPGPGEGPVGPGPGEGPVGPGPGEGPVGPGPGEGPVDARPVTSRDGGVTSLPFTGGEVTLMALAGTAALGGGITLVVAGRKRQRA